MIYTYLAPAVWLLVVAVHAYWMHLTRDRLDKKIIYQETHPQSYDRLRSNYIMFDEFSQWSKSLPYVEPDDIKLFDDYFFTENKCKWRTHTRMIDLYKTKDWLINTSIKHKDMCAICQSLKDMKYFQPYVLLSDIDKYGQFNANYDDAIGIFILKKRQAGRSQMFPKRKPTDE